MSRKRQVDRHAKTYSGFKPRKVAGRSFNQVQYIKTVLESDITLCWGPPGSGKTHLAVGLAVRALRDCHVERIAITRPVVDVGNSIGYLPGTMEEKVGPYLTPLFDELNYYCEASLLQKWLAEKTLEIVPLSMMRGRTFNNTFVILDEAQNATMSELRMFLTRIGMNSKMVLTGDLHQSDLPIHLSGGFTKCIKALEDVVGTAELQMEDIVRHPLIAAIEERLENVS